MIITTTNTIEGKHIDTYIGLATGEAIMGANALRDLMASIRDVIGGRSHAYEEKFAEARETALAEMQEKASAMGANAVVGIEIDYEVLGQNNGMLMVTATGTAVSLQE